MEINLNELLVFLFIIGILLMHSGMPSYPTFQSDKIWITKNGDKIKLSDMNVHHIAYTIDYCKKYHYKEEYIFDLEKELYLRWDSEHLLPLPEKQERYTNV